MEAQNMADATYYQEGAAGLGKPDASSEKPSTEALSPNDAAPEANGTEVVTKAELQRIKAEIEESVLRKTQSMTDKLGSKLDVRIKTAQDEAEKAIRMLKASGVALTPEQERSISQNAVNEALTAKEASEAAQHQEAQSKPNDFVNGEVRKIMKRTGVYLEPDEANALIGEVDSPFDYVRKFEEICQSRSTRPPEESRIPTLAQGGTANNLASIEQQYRNEIELISTGKHPSIRRGNAQAIADMKAEYRKKGLSVY
jgi:DNA-directed RNA polymerase subunit F